MADSVNLQKSYSLLNERLAKLFDESGVRRSFTVPYVLGQAMADHINSVGQAAAQAGGLTSNLLTTAHHSSGKGWGSGEGETVAHSADKLRSTIIPKNDEKAKAAIDAAQKNIDNCAKLLGDDDPAVMTSKGQLDLVKKSSGEGMNLLDFGVMMLQVMQAPIQAVARAHSGTKEGGHAPHLRAPGGQPVPEGQDAGSEPQGEAPEGQQAPEDQSAAPEDQAAPQGAPQASPAVAAPQAQG